MERAKLDRRAFLEGLFGAACGGLLASCSKPEPRPIEGELLGQSHQHGHLLRKDLGARIAAARALSPEVVDVVIVGGGPSGLSAAWRLTRKEKTSFVVLELEDQTGGTSRGGRSEITPYPWGAHYLPIPSAENEELVRLLREMNVVSGTDDEGALIVTEPHLVRKPDERIFYRGYFYPGLYPFAGSSVEDRDELKRFEGLCQRYANLRDGSGRRAFAIPLRKCSDDPELTKLDQVSARVFLEQQGFRSQRLFWLCDYACRDDYGTRLSDTSAWALLFYFASRIHGQDGEPAELITWPEGNFALVRHLSSVVGARVRCHELVFDVRQTDDAVHVLAWDVKRNVPRHYRAKRAILSTPRFITQHIVAELREDRDLGSFTYAPWLVANLHIDTRPSERGTPLAWDNVLYESSSLGYVCATHQRGSDFGPTVFTYYLPLVHVDPVRARNELLPAPISRHRDALLSDLTRAHPNLAEVTRRIDVFAWGHAMVRPSVGFVWSEARRKASEARGRIHFAHSDLSGLSLFEEAFDHGLRAADEVVRELSS